MYNRKGQKPGVYYKESNLKENSTLKRLMKSVEKLSYSPKRIKGSIELKKKKPSQKKISFRKNKTDFVTSPKSTNKIYEQCNLHHLKNYSKLFISLSTQENPLYFS